MNSTPMVYSNTGTPLNDPEHIRWQRAVRLDLVASRSYNNTEMDMDMPAPTPEPVKALRDEELQFVRAQQALNLSPTASNNASAMSETTEMDFTSTNGITGAEVQFKREQGALQSTSQQDDDMDIECGNLNSNTGMEYMELGKVRRQREQHFSQPRPTIEETLPQQKEYYSRNQLTDEQDPEFAMLVDLDAPNDEWNRQSALMRVLQFRSDLSHEFNIQIHLSRKRCMSASEQLRFLEQSTASEFFMLRFPTEEHLQIALRRRILLNGFEMSAKRHIQAREPLGRTLLDYERSRSASLEAQKDESMDDLVSGLSSFGVTRNCAEEDRDGLNIN